MHSHEPRRMSRRRLRGGGRSTACAVAGLLGLLLFSRAAPAQEGDVPVSPYVLLLLDTSAIMLNQPGLEVPPVCGAVPPGKSRWISVQEALAGSVPEAYQCEADPIPHPASGDFGGDGVLRAVGDAVRFGMMTMDTNTGDSATAAGGYSYGPSVNGAGGVTNLGGRNSVAAEGALMGFHVLAGNVGNAVHNEELTARLRGVAPHTPIVPAGDQASLAALLADTRYFFSNHPSVQEGSEAEGSDPQAACRPKSVILITGARSRPAYDDLFKDEGDPEGPYDGSDEQAARLLAEHGVVTHVLYFSSGDPLLADRMAQLAAAGGSEQPRPVTDASSLRLGLAEIVNSLLEGVRSNTKTATTFQTFDSGIAQIQVAAAYTVPTLGRWHGHLEFSRFRCNEDRPADVHDFGRILDGDDADISAQATRQILTPIAGTLAPLQHSAAGADGLTGGQLGLPDAEAAALVDFVWDRRNNYYPLREHRLGAIVHSNPQVVGPPYLELPFPAYGGVLPGGREGFRRRFDDRPTMAYVGADDGMLHGFMVAGPEALSNRVGHELFGFVPQALQRSLRQLSDPAAHLPMVDGTPIVRDLRLNADYGNPSNEQWITALLSGAGRGGRFYYALNVSDPMALAATPGGDIDGVPFYLWEINGAAGDAVASVRDRMGLTQARPAVGSVVTESEGQREEVAVAFLAGGQEVAGLPHSGRALWVVAIEPSAPGQARILRTFVDTQGNVDEMIFPITGTPAAYGALPGQPTTRVFVGDAGGRMWRIDTSDSDPAQWSMRVFHDPYPGGRDDPNRQPVFYEPSLALRSGGQLTVQYVTGDPDNLQDQAGNHDHKLVSLTERINVLDDGGIEAAAATNFAVTFQPGEVPSSPTLVFDSTIFFGTYVHDQDTPCSFGETRIWGLDFVGNDPDSEADVLPRFPTNKQSETLGPDGGWRESAPAGCDEEEAPAGGGFSREALYCLMPTGSLVRGIEVSRSPACEDQFGDALQGGDDGGGGQGGGGGGGRPVLTVQTGRFVPVGLLGVPMEGASRAPRLRRGLNPTRLSTVPLMWGLVFDD